MIIDLTIEDSTDNTPRATPEIPKASYSAIDAPAWISVSDLNEFEFVSNLHHFDGSEFPVMM